MWLKPDEDDDEEQEEEDKGVSSALQYKVFSMDTLYFMVCSKITNENDVNNGPKFTWIFFGKITKYMIHYSIQQENPLQLDLYTTLQYYSENAIEESHTSFTIYFFVFRC